MFRAFSFLTISMLVTVRRPALRREPAKNFFILFVDAIFTTLLEPLFTKAREVLDEKSATACLCHARHVD